MPPSNTNNTLTWVPSGDARERSAMGRFFGFASGRSPSAPAADAPWADWHAWSVAHREAFWGALWDFTGVRSEELPGGGAWDATLVGRDRMAPPDPLLGPSWFMGARLNFAENLLRGPADALAIIARDERGRRRQLTYGELTDAVAACAAAMRALGLRPGDRVAGLLPNIPEAVIGMLAAASIGCVWTSCSPDFGVNGVLDRFGQVAPRLLICVDGYQYADKAVDSLSRVRDIVDALPAVERVVVVPFLHEAPNLHGIRGAVAWHAFTASGYGRPLRCERLPFDHPLYVMYSSGTTGLPKCMVHGAGGTLLQHLKEHQLHLDLRPGERLFYFTTCGWMMWNWLVSALASQATIVLYDGAPMPSGRESVLWEIAADERVSVFGTSARYLAMSEKSGLAPARTLALGALRAILSTGSPLAAHSYDYVARDVKPGVMLASISGGTDLISCFALGNPLLPVRRGELQSYGLGMAVEVWNADGERVVGEPGELVCTAPFPSMPVAFFNDPDGARYRDAYFTHFPGVWRHGDWAEETPHGGLVIHGRSDATLNPGGVRIGTAEIYRQVELVPEVLESVVIGQDIPDGTGGTDVRIVLFVRLRPGEEFNEALADHLRRAIRVNASPHHVPRVILPVADIPRTLSGKISEIAVRDIVAGREVTNAEALANPGALELFRGLPALRVTP
ncbi:MAG: acetoacetate--CoA ligase [Gemmatimonadetes bacterium]|nr:acetoacetate--CoA ligase [Gemmatimonadota bacterium]